MGEGSEAGKPKSALKPRQVPVRTSGSITDPHQ
jgi:hypothetical protein